MSGFEQLMPMTSHSRALSRSSAAPIMSPAASPSPSPSASSSPAANQASPAPTPSAAPGASPSASPPSQVLQNRQAQGQLIGDLTAAEAHALMLEKSLSQSQLGLVALGQQILDSQKQISELDNRIATVTAQHAELTALEWLIRDGHADGAPVPEVGAARRGESRQTGGTQKT